VVCVALASDQLAVELIGELLRRNVSLPGAMNIWSASRLRVILRRSRDAAAQAAPLQAPLCWYAGIVRCDSAGDLHFERRGCAMRLLSRVAAEARAGRGRCAAVKGKPIMPRPQHHLTIAFLLVPFLFVTGLSAQAGDRCDSLCITPARTISFETSEGTQMNLDLSPDGGTILFDLLGDLYTVPRAGGVATPLTSGMAMDRQPVFSPDGTRILFVSDRSGNENLWLIDADGSNPRPITTERGDFHFADPEWSPDGEYILVRRNQAASPNAGRQPWLIHLRGGAGMPLASDADGTGFRWDPTGRYVYFRGTETRGAVGLRGNSVPERAQIMRLDRRTGDIAAITTVPSGAARPAISPDGEWLVYVADVDAMSGLRLRNLVTAEDRWLAFPIDREELDRRTRFAFVPGGDAVIFEKDGTFHEAAIRTGEVRKISFTARVQKQLGPRVYHEIPFRDDSLIVRNVRYAEMSPDGSRLVFGSLNQIWIMDLPHGEPRPLIRGGRGQYQPTFSPDGSSIAFVSWDAAEGGHLWRVPVAGGAPRRLTTYPAYYANPAWSPDGSRVVYVREDPAATRNRNSNNRGFVEWVPSTGGESRAVVSAPSNNVFTLTADGERITFAERGTLVSVRLDGTDRREIATVAGAAEMVPSPDGRWLAFTLREEVYIAALPPSVETVELSARSGPGPFQRVTRDGGQDLRWANDGETLTWVFGNVFSRLDLDDVFGADAPETGLDRIARTVPIRLVVPMPRPEGSVALTGATVVTMRGDEVLRDATVVVTGNRISAVGPSGSVRVPDGARVIDVSGRTVIPGLIDAHAHIRGMPRDVLVDIAPEPLVNLAFGVTMARDVNASTDQFHYRELIAAGRMLGPRIFMTGPSQTSRAVEIRSYEDALAGVQRYVNRGSFSTKQYLQPERRQIQWMLRAADELGINATAEGGGVMRQVAMILDGYTGIEHAPTDWANIYDDVVQLYARSGTMYTPTLVVASPDTYQGELYWYQTSDVHANEKLAHFLPHEALDHKSRTSQRYAPDEFYFLLGGAGSAAISRAGGLVASGGHGQVHGLAVHWELWMLEMTGMTPHEALRAATLNVATGMGMAADFGSIEVGKVADLVVLDENPLEDIRNSTSIRYVMRGGELYDGDTLDMIWPEVRPLGPFRYVDFGPPPHSEWIR
jgi:Tol biopolymer transport system component/imidazolonepropionase-like amidohydrolase